MAAVRGLTEAQSRRIARKFSIPCLIREEQLFKLFPDIEIKIPPKPLSKNNTATSVEPAQEQIKIKLKSAVKSRTSGSVIMKDEERPKNIKFTTISRGGKALKRRIISSCSNFERDDFIDDDWKPRMAGNKQPMKRATGHARSNGKRVPSPVEPPPEPILIDTNNMVDETLVIFLPEFSQRFDIESPPLDPKGLCNAFSIIVPNLEMTLPS